MTYDRYIPLVGSKHQGNILYLKNIKCDAPKIYTSSISCTQIIGCNECCLDVWPWNGCRWGWKVERAWKTPYMNVGGTTLCCRGMVGGVTRNRVFSIGGRS